MSSRLDRRWRWLRRAARGLRLAVGVLTLGVFVVAGAAAAAVFGRDSPLVWSISLVAGLTCGVLLVGRPELRGLATRSDRAADGGGQGADQRSARGA